MNTAHITYSNTPATAFIFALSFSSSVGTLCRSGIRGNNALSLEMPRRDSFSDSAEDDCRASAFDKEAEDETIEDMSDTSSRTASAP